VPAGFAADPCSLCDASEGDPVVDRFFHGCAQLVARLLSGGVSPEECGPGASYAVERLHLLTVVGLVVGGKPH
jgi:hypothetical protein